MRKSQLFSLIAAAVAAPGLVIGAAAPASALASAGLNGTCGPWYNQTCVGYAQDVPGVGSGSDVQVVCSAAGTYEVQATVVQCYIEGNNGDVHWTNPTLTSGQASAQTVKFPAWSLESRSYRVCVGAGFYDNWGNYYAPDGFTCGASV